jgi:hypothetical protein
VCNLYLKNVTLGAGGDHDIAWGCRREDWCFQHFLAHCVPSELRAKTFGSEGSNIFDADDLILQERSYFPHVWLVDEQIFTGLNTLIDLK